MKSLLFKEALRRFRPKRKLPSRPTAVRDALEDAAQKRQQFDTRSVEPLEAPPHPADPSWW